MKHLKELRIQRKLTQKDVADFLQISRSAYTNYETDRREPDRETLLKLSEYFDVSVDYLMDSERSVGKLSFSKQEFDNALFAGIASPDKFMDDLDKQIRKSAIEERLNSNPEIADEFNRMNEHISAKLLAGQEMAKKEKSPSELDELLSDPLNKELFDKLAKLSAAKKKALLALIEDQETD